MADEEKSKELTRSSFAAQMAMLGYEPNGNPKDMVEVVLCKDCKHGYRCEFGIRCENKNMPPVFGQHFSENWFCADGERREVGGV